MWDNKTHFGFSYGSTISVMIVNVTNELTGSKTDYIYWLDSDDGLQRYDIM